ncbi:CHAD domain-containing protein [Luteolibacter sp. SL250]|uniref:CHAD domain-containing protein n=1 Tax=Luteolibacter sp. SL250 TaxID=2995170 RepID=UPI00226E6CAA|nr:CHAD domain-containing protein [Luteolibacter sp. SL250]WAC21193.1 CHAD domain-containing protein [Luteolibacter sp. SL250]
MNHRNHIDPAADLDDEIRRISGRRIAGSLKWLRRIREQPAEAVHEVRKDLKRLRALVRLLQDTLGKRRHRKLQRDLRNAGRLLSAFRDAEVRLQLVKNLVDQSDPAARRALEEAVERIQSVHQGTVKTEDLEEAADEVMTLLRGARRRLRVWVVPSEGLGKQMEGALFRSFEKARLAMRRTLIHPVAENFHDWRKACKTLRHQLDLVMQPGGEGGEHPRIGTLHELSEHLGNLNDLDVLEESLEPLAEGTLDIAGLSAIRRELEERRTELVRESWAAGEGIFSREAENFIPLRGHCPAFSETWLDSPG